MHKKSNVMPISNVYITSGELGKDIEFRARVRGRENLRKMVKQLAGLKWVDNVSLDDHYRKYLSPLQIQEWDLGMYCALQEDKQDLIRGLVRKGKQDSFECRCYHFKCRHFNQCRPNFDPEKGPSIIVRISDWKPGAAVTKQEIIIPDITDIEEISHVGESDVTRLPDDSIDTIIFEDEPDLTDNIELQINKTRSGEPVAPVLQGQEAIIKAEPGEHLLVLAGPGTGKTYCLIEKLKYLVEENGSIEADSILILCFTRAAVREIRDRFLYEIETGDYSDNLSRLEIRTFDSFATRVLIARDVDVTAKSYDERIQMVIDEILSDPDILMDMRHFIVDEIQDLVGVRARLVQTILECRPEECGLTLLGDHLQGIYDYQIKDIIGELNASGLIKWVREQFSDSLYVAGLTENQRQSGNLSDFSIRARQLLESGIHEQIQKFFDIIKKIKTCGPEHKFNIPLEENRKVAILCRNNGEVLKISNNLRRWGIQHTIRRGKRNQPRLPVWVADLLAGDCRVISRDFLEQVNNNGKQWHFEDKDRIFYALKSLTSANRESVNADEAKQALASGVRLPDEFYEIHKEAICVSTIHQSKGREYDNVLFFRPDNRFQEEELFEEAKVFYVAITRAKNQVLAIDRRKSDTYLTSNVSSSGRWTELGRRQGNKKRLVAVEIGLEDDIDEQSFVDKDLLIDPSENQKYIREKLKPGQQVELRRIDEEKKIYYGIFHEGKLLGKMSQSFLRDMKNVMSGVYGKSNHIPRGFEEVYVDRVYSVVKKPETIRNSVREHWARSGVWYAINVMGVGLVRWDFEC